MLVVEASDQYVGSSNPLVEGEVLAAQEDPGSPIREEDVHPGFRQEEIERADQYMQEHTLPDSQPVQSEQTRQLVQQPEPVTVTQPTATVTQRFGSAASAEEPKSAGTKRKSAESDSADDSAARELRKARAKIAKQKEQLKESQKAEREAKDRALKLSEERNQQLQRELDEFRATRSTSAPSGSPDTAPEPPALTATVTQQPSESPVPAQPAPTAEPSAEIIPEGEQPTGKKGKGKPQKGKAQREAEKLSKKKRKLRKPRKLQQHLPRTYYLWVPLQALENSRS